MIYATIMTHYGPNVGYFPLSCLKFCKYLRQMTIIDPPSGWKYGFPKPIPEDRLKDSTVWLVEQGYPQHLIDDLGEHFYCRYWQQPEESQVNDTKNLTND